MGRKKKRNRPVVFCYYCDRNFETERVLLQHQRSKHFKCPTCHKKISSARGMMIHVFQIHKETIETVPGAKEGRDSFDTEIFGMEGVPAEMVEEKRIQMFGAPATKKQKLEQNSGHPLLSGIPGPDLIIPGTSSTTQTNSSLGSMHPARQMMLANVQGFPAPAAPMPMFGMGMGFPSMPLPLHLPPPPPPKPWPPKQPQVSQAPQMPQAQLPKQPPPPKRKPIITTPHGQPGAMKKQDEPQVVAPVASPQPSVVNQPPPPATMPLPPVPPPVSTPAPPAQTPSLPVAVPAPPQLVTVAPPPEAVILPPPSAILSVAADSPASSEAKELASLSKKKKKNSILIYEERYVSQEEKRAMAPRYSAHLNRRIASLSSSIEERLRSLQ